MRISIKKLKLNDLLIYSVVVFSFISYEHKTYQKYYQLMIMSVLVQGVILLLFNIKNIKMSSIYIRNLRKNFAVHLLSILIIFTTLISSIKYKIITFTGLIIVVSTILSFYVFYLFIPIIIYRDLDNKIQKIVKIITFFSIISIFIGIRGGFLGYIPTDYKRIASIFFDPNYFGTIASIGFIFAINREGKYKVYAFLNLIALYLSGSRAAMITLIFVMVIFFIYNKRIGLKSILKFVALGIVLFFGIGFLVESNFFRTHQFLSSRDFLWRLSFELIVNEPLWGYGYGSVGDLIRSMGAQNASSHNAYLDFIIMYGIPAFIVNTFIIIKATILGFKYKLPQEITKSIVFLLIVANSISINLGGLGVLSLLLTLFLGLSNMAPYVCVYELNSKENTRIRIEKSVSI